MRRKSTTPPQTALVPSLPGEGAVDRGLVETAVRDINRLYVQKGLETARGVGEYLLNTFFEGDTETFEAREGGHASFRALSEHEDLRVSHSFLWYAVRLLPQLRVLPERVASALPLSHHRLLLHVRDEKAKQKLAERAVQKGFGKRELEGEIRKLRRSASPGAVRGRKPLPTFVKAFNRLQKVARDLDTHPLDETDVLHFGIAEAQKYLSDVEATLARLGTLRGQLASRVAAFKPPA